MPRKPFRWTRAKYKRAHHLARFLSRVHGLSYKSPALVERYIELWEQHPQFEDPLLTPYTWRRPVDDFPY